MQQSINLGKVVPIKGEDYFTEADIAEVRQGMQEQITSSNKLASDLIDDSNSTLKLTTASEKATWNAKEDASNKVTSIDENSSDTEYPSAKAVYDELATKQDTLASGTTITVLQSSPVRLWDLDTGIYKLPSNCKIYYVGATATNGVIINGEGILIVNSNVTNKYWFIFSGENSTHPRAGRYIFNGNVTQSTGNYTIFNIRSECETTLNKTTRVSASSTDTQYPSAKAVYDAIQAGGGGGGGIPVLSTDTNLWETNPGIYSVEGSSDIKLYYNSTGYETITAATTAYLIVNNSNNSSITYFLFYDAVIECGIADSSSGTIAPLSGGGIKLDINFTDGSTGYNSYAGQVVEVTSYTNQLDTTTNDYNDFYYVESANSTVIFKSLRTHLYNERNTTETSCEPSIYKIEWNATAQGWVVGDIQLVSKSTTISSGSDNNHLATAKAVYDALPTTFTGTDGVDAGTTGLVPAPATTDADKYLKSDGTWSTVQAGTTITYGMTDLTPGVSPLNEGEFYFVYE